MPSDYELVREFTSESTGVPTPLVPEPMTRDEVFFLMRMMIDEIVELGATVAQPEIVKYEMIKYVTESKYIPMSKNTGPALIAEQADALIDPYYYSLNACAKKGINISSMFLLVHQANMNKRDPVTKKFIKRYDGKIMKPEGWKEPDLISEVIRQSKSVEDPE